MEGFTASLLSFITANETFLTVGRTREVIQRHHFGLCKVVIFNFELSQFYRLNDLWRVFINNEQYVFWIINKPLWKLFLPDNRTVLHLFLSLGTFCIILPLPLSNK